MPRSHKRIDRDKYVTPMWCVDLVAAAIEQVTPSPDWVVDLGAGDGRIGLKVRDAVQGRNGMADLMLIDVERGWSDDDLEKVDNLYLHRHGDVEFVCKLEDCGHRMDPILRDKRVLYVSNPPFSLSEEWVRKAVGVVKNIHQPGSAAVFLLRADWLATKRRSDLVEKYPPDRIDYISPRPSFAHGATDMREYCWFWWGHGPYRGTEVKSMRRES